MATNSDNNNLWITCNQASCSEEEQPLPSQVPGTEQSRESSSCLSATEWQLRRYGRFMPGALGTASGSWEVLESSKESGFLVLTIVISGHFFISREKEVLNKQRMFRVQFMGDSKTHAEEHCCQCMQKLADYVPLQEMDAARQELRQGHSLTLDGESQLKDAEQNVPMQHNAENVSPAQGRLSVSEVAQYIRTTNIELPFAYQQSMWNAEDLGSFIHLCLLDKSFPAFVEEVEKQLKKITDG
ncbi:hypothetical protein EYD10_01985 [Varanus komodoensis]|uniref:meiotic recombination protein REC114 isoform X3 n=1 Tax=Varanus komodoensis TaxID=61221 RepID=UPI001CF79E99|nr:meiotic recombination protein REC114 isoform X3 [Varanus komodoensis]KAF7252883.1 hypothetical protein EYD10_01985 [Varanus komodoensis]